ncbi:MAG TPA: hypothetical protein VN616_02980 [Puia sp.]|nr:hypothetical protein [Puia sp.]
MQFLPLFLAFFLAVVAILYLGLYVNFLFWLGSRDKPLPVLSRVADKLVMLTVLIVLWNDFGQANDCCGDSALFSPHHRLTAMVLILASIAAYGYPTLRGKLAPPLVGIGVNCGLLYGIVLDILVGVQLNDPISWCAGGVQRFRGNPGAACAAHAPGDPAAVQQGRPLRP